jgi:perosamine synthetase
MLCDPGPSWPPQSYRERVAERVAGYLARGGALSVPDGSGPIAELEGAFSRWLSAPHVLAVNSGTSALYASFHAVGVSTGSEVVVPAITFHASVTPILHFGGTPVLADVDATTGNLDPDAFERSITPRTKAVVVTHLYGVPAPIERIVTIARARGIAVIEDASHAHGATIDGRAVGTFGDAGVFSLQENKLAPAGEGGILVTRHRHLFERALVFSQFGARLEALTDPALRRLVATGLGLKLRLHPLAALAGLEGLSLHRATLDGRRRQADLVARALPRSFALHDGSGAVLYRFRLLLHSAGPSRAEVLERAAAHRLPIRSAEVVPLYELPLFRGAGRELGVPWEVDPSASFIGAETFRSRLVGMPTWWSDNHDEARATFLDRAREVFAS